MAELQMPEAIVFDSVKDSELNSPLVKIYGLTVFERTLKSLESAEISNIKVFADKNFDAFDNLIKKHNWKCDLQLLEKSAFSPEINKPTLILSEPLLITPRYIKEIIEAGQRKETFATDPNGYVAFLSDKIIAGGLQYKSNLNETIKAIEVEGIKRTKADSIGRIVCEPVPDKKSRKQAVGRLIRSLRQPSDEFISRTFNRPISLFITRYITGHTPITANQFTLFTGVMGLITAFILSLGGDKNFLIGGIMFHFLAVLDAGDGEIARLKFLASERGQWIDTIVDNITYVATLGGLIVGVFRSDPSNFVIYSSIAGVIFLVLALLSLYIYLIKYNRGGSLVNIDYDFKDDTGWYGKIMDVLQELGRRPFFSIVFMFLGIFGIMEFSLVYVSIMTFFIFAYSIQAHIRAAQKS
ncbi:MAG: CDP-alcohol phosphatidyltransferase family protein [Cyclobacteriaceae bacterium]